jgi:hypothetical protein
MSEMQAIPQKIDQAAYLDIKQERKPDFGARHNRGVGSIIGAVFIALILLSGFAFYALTIDATQNYNDTISTMSGLDWNRSQENIVFKQISITGTNRLNVTAENDGSIQSHLTWLGIFNKTATPENQTYQALNEFIRPGETDNIISNSTVTTGNNYVIQLVSELGNTVDSKFYPANFFSCALTLVTAPPTVYQGNNITVLFTVTPNDTVVDSIQSLTATINATPSNLVQLMANSSLCVNGLTRGSSVFFWWIYNATNIGTVTFNATYVQAPSGTYVLSTAQVANPPQQGGQGSVTITGVNCTVSQNPSQWNLLGSTQNVNGSASTIANNDQDYALFRSYYTGTTTYATSYVSNNVSNVDSSANVGTQSNFTAMQYGPDSTYNTLTEGNTGGTGYHWGIDSSSFTYSSTHTDYRYMGGTSPNVDNMVVTKLHIRYSGTGTVAIALYTGGTLSDPTGATRRTQAYNVSVSSGWNTINVPAYNWPKNTVTWIGWCHSGGGVYYSSNSWDAGDFQSSRGRWSQTSPANADESSSMPTNPGAGSFDNYWYAVYVEYDTPSYKMDLEAQWTGLNPSQQNASLCIYGGAMAAENILVDAWNGSWQNVFPILNPGWNNQSVISYLTSSNFTIRFRAQNSTDVVQDSWQIDVSLLQFSNTTDAYTAEVEFTGTSNLQNWTRLAWLTDSSWDTSNVTVTIQLYNYTLLNYPSSGNGYYTYVSSATAYTDETKSQTITSGATQFRSSTLPYYWKIKIKGVKTTSTQFQMRIDWIELQDSYTSTGDSVPYKAWQWYTIQATTAGNPIPFTYFSLYSNGTTVTFQNATDGTTVPNPAWLQTDTNGTFQLQLRSLTSSGEMLVLNVAVGTTAQQKTITQVAQQ